MLALVLLLAAAIHADSNPQADIAALKADGVPNNAWQAIDRLRKAGPEVIPLLEAALDSADHTQRHLAASLLRHRDDCPVSSRLIRVSVEALKHDTLPASLRSSDEYLASFWACNASDSVEWLGDHTIAAASEVRAALASTDPQQSFLAAVVCGHGRIDGTRDAAARILLPHLSHNTIHGDGVLAAVALQRMGPGVLPLIRAWHDGDAQHRAFVGQIIRELEHPQDRHGNTIAARQLRLGIGENALADTRLTADTLQWDPAPAPPPPPPPPSPAPPPAK